MSNSEQTQQFLERLQKEAALQSRLHRERLLPQRLDSLTSLVGNYPWQVILVLSGVSALLLELMR